MNDTEQRSSARFWQVTAFAACLTVVVFSGISGALLDSGFGNVPEFVIGALVGAATVTLFALVITVATRLLRRVPSTAAALFGAALLSLWFFSSNSVAELIVALLDTSDWSWPDAWLDALSPWALASIVLAIAGVSGLVVLVVDGSASRAVRSLRNAATIWVAGLTIVAVVVVLGLAGDGSDPFPDDGAALTPQQGVGALPDPGVSGDYTHEHLTYGAGINKRRPEFGSRRDLESRTVDATDLLPDWKDFKKDMRERFWGFGLEDAPLNGQVWAPTGAGPFPLVLIVHGNHGMEDYSDSGYAYLGELLASRGFIVVSVDENYINGSWSGDFRGKEMAARAWLMLEHLALWRDWNGTAAHRFHARVDMDNIALVGHSRGGEAVAIAHLFNGLPHFPDDATVKFDYGFNIRSLVAIAQVDQRYHRRVELRDVNFFTIHGSYDSDEPAYHGMRQFNRIELGDEGYFIKAGLYIHGANHGQFNTGWGRADYSPPDSWRLNLAPLISGDEQRQVAKAYIVAFLESTLRGDDRYLALLKDPRVGARWLPQRTYVNQFTDSTFRPLADFEEDLDVTTASLPGAAIASNALALWREEDLEHRDQRKQGSNAVIVGWREPQAEYSIDFAAAADLAQGRSLVFAISGSTEKLPEEDGAEEESDDTDDDVPAISDFSVELTDANGTSSRVLVSEHAGLVPPVRVRYLKNRALNEEAYVSDWEPVLQHIEISLDAFVAVAPGIDLAAIRTVRFRFDQADEGVLILDNIGLLAL